MTSTHLTVDISNNDIFKKTALILPEDISEQQTIEVGIMLSRAESGVQWWIGDLWNARQKRGWGCGPEFTEAIGVDYKSAREYGKVSGKYQLANRMANLSWTHHQVVAYEPEQTRRELLEWCVENGASVSQLKQERTRKRLEKTISENSDLNVENKYQVIYTDPPWRYDFSKSNSREIENQYPTMSLDEICNLPITEITETDCVLFLWTTSPKLEEAFIVLKSWGFEYKTSAVWDKQKIGMGYYFRQQHELLLVATKGNLPVPDSSDRISSVFSFPRSKHSSKPIEVINALSKMYPKNRKIELFCRDPQAGWDVWGNQSGT